ncbi:MAG: hypothetical protein L3I91_02950 [Mycoplasma sp.]
MKRFLKFGALLSIPAVVAPILTTCGTVNNFQAVKEVLLKNPIHDTSRDRVIIHKEGNGTQSKAIHDLVKVKYPDQKSINNELINFFFKKLQEVDNKTGEEKGKDLLTLEEENKVEIEVITDQVQLDPNGWQFETVNNQVQAYLRFQFRINFGVLFLEDGPSVGLYKDFKKQDFLQYVFEAWDNKNPDNYLFELKLLTSETSSNNFNSLISFNQVNQTSTEPMLGFYRYTINQKEQGNFPITINNLTITTGWDQFNATVYDTVHYNG